MNNKPVSCKELLNSSAQELIEEINSKRKRDSALLAGTCLVIIVHNLKRSRRFNLQATNFPLSLEAFVRVSK